MRLLRNYFGSVGRRTNLRKSGKAYKDKVGKAATIFQQGIVDLFSWGIFRKYEKKDTEVWRKID